MNDMNSLKGCCWHTYHKYKENKPHKYKCEICGREFAIPAYAFIHAGHSDYRDIYKE